MATLNESSDSQLKQELYALTAFCQAVLDSGHDSVIAKRTLELIKERKFEDYLELNCNPDDYACPQKFADDWQIVKMLSKSPNLPIDVDRRLEAELSFLDSEVSCMLVNKRMDRTSMTEEPLWMFEMRQIIRNVLPPLTSSELEAVSRGFSHGPGSTTGVKGVGSCVVEKYESNIHYTASLEPFLRAVMGQSWYESINGDLTVVRGGRFTTVLKKALTDRGIIIPPTANVYMQKGVGKRIRHHLRRSGLDLNFQQEKNREAARRAYTDQLCTFDLHAASDSIAKSVVERLLPDDWYKLLCLCRENSVFFAGDYRPMHKFSAMGNGFTFELETLIFWALLKAVIPTHRHKSIQVYGDDLIFPREFASIVTEALNYLGFSVNRSKSFLAGSFFESCGADWFKGFNVRPFCLKGASDNIPYAVTIANRLRVYSKRRGNGVFCDSRFKPLWDAFAKVCPSKYKRCVVPEELGDVGLIGAESELLLSKPTSGLIEGKYIRTVSGVAEKQPYLNFGVLLDKLAQCGSSPSQLDELLRSKLGNDKHRCFLAQEFSSHSVVVRKEEKIPVASMFAMYPLRGRMAKTKLRWTLIYHWSSGFEWSDESPAI